MGKLYQFDRRRHPKRQLGPARRPFRLVWSPTLLLAGMSFVGLAFFAATHWFMQTQFQRELQGSPRVIDGDTLAIGNHRLRLHGIDAPEAAQTCRDSQDRAYRCGTVSATGLLLFTGQTAQLRCVLVDRDRYGRHVARCYRKDGASVSAWLVRNGHALAWLRYGGWRYMPEQVLAWWYREGLWRGTFEDPSRWRRR
ncbi:thermonuclease family protein [Stappia sp. MMSF_3263]|uniref:thermonuclease family protein n=1 Tax=Stappia sp. MMSF_3263 TaxID=3046693 RepID=UPI00273FF4A0|nr:thermonuclease family protein [Stappia sp. MMSF_3263]